MHSRLLGLREMQSDVTPDTEEENLYGITFSAFLYCSKIMLNLLSTTSRTPLFCATLQPWWLTAFSAPSLSTVHPETFSWAIESLYVTFQHFSFFLNYCFTLCVVFLILCARDVISPKFTSVGSSTREKAFTPKQHCLFCTTSFLIWSFLWKKMFRFHTILLLRQWLHTTGLLCPVKYLHCVKFLLLHLKCMSRNLWVFWA